MSDGEHCEKDPTHSIESTLSKLRSGLDLKHTQNRADIHSIERQQEALKLEVRELTGRIDPYLDNGQPGLFSRMSVKLDGLIEQVTEIRVKQGTDAGRRDVYGWLRAVLASAIVGLLIVLAQHLWK